MLAKLALHAGRSRHVVVSLRDEGHVGSILSDAGVELHTLGMHRPSGLLSFPVRLAAIIRRLRPDIIQGWMNHGNLLALLGARLARSTAPVLWNVRQSFGDMRHEKRLTRAVIRLEAKLSRAPAGIIYNSRAGAEQHEAAGFTGANRRLIPNGFDVDRFYPSPERRTATRAELGVGPEEILVGLVARVHSMKNHPAFLAAARMVIEKEPRVRFLLAGSGSGADDAELRALAPHPAMAERSLFLGLRTDVPEITRALDIACNVSVHGEGFPNAIGEAMASAVPCVVTDVGDSARIVGETGMVCASGTPVDIADGILRMVREGADGRRRRGALARERVVQCFSIQAVVAQYEDYYDEILQQHSHRPKCGNAAPTARPNS